MACIQTTTGPDVDKNFLQSRRLIREATCSGINLAVLPEMVNVMDLSRKRLAAKTFFEDDDPTLSAFCGLARELQIYLILGSLVVKHGKLDGKGHPKLANRSFMIDRSGAVIARYDKIHMFDVNIDGSNSFMESKAFEAGHNAVIADTPWGKLGVTICYDLRFPHLYRHLAQKGAIFFTVPAAFARSTGKSHWHTLIRARAIENSCYIFAAAQCGDHGEGWFTYGHSLIVDPWGKVLVDGGDKIGFIAVEIDVELVEQTRRRIPSIFSDQAFT